MKKDKKKEPPMDPTGEHPLNRFGPKSLVCSACKTAAKQFQGKVARKIKGKWKEEKKRKTFEDSLPDACAASAYPESMVVFDRGEGQSLGDMSDTMRGGGRTLSIQRAWWFSIVVRDNPWETCPIQCEVAGGRCRSREHGGFRSWCGTIPGRHVRYNARWREDVVDPESMVVFDRGAGQSLGDMSDTMRGGGR